MGKIRVDGDSDKDIAKIDELTTKICQIIADADCDARVKVQVCCNALAFAIGTDYKYRNNASKTLADAMFEVTRLVQKYVEYYNQQN